ncbi:DUF4145 domain-containing protein [Micromonospora saelicesensis]|uniref:DUF4145 domain-containing protein n=1 Tax=Micromonospora saelicesensis TaxID=285676 RepID=UPI003CF13BAA
MAKETSEEVPLRALNCPHCKNLTLAYVRGASLLDDDSDIAVSQLLLLQCRACEANSLHQEVDFGDRDKYFYQVWPEERRPLSFAVPKELRAEHEEAVACLRSGAHTAAVVMVRRTLEGICRLNSVSKRTLFEGLRELQQRGQIDDRLMEWAEELRTLGNQGAHFTGTKVSREDASDAVDFAEAMLDYMYVLTVKFAEFKSRRASKSSSVGNAQA